MSALAQPADDPRHVSVLRDEAIAALAIAPDEAHVDGTFGAGGYTRSMLAAGARVYAIDRDPRALSIGCDLVAQADGRLTLIDGRFADMVSLLAAHGVAAVDGIVLDIGVSSMQIDEADRGFSFQADGPLDMRMSSDGISAAEWLNTAPVDDIADVLFHYGEERQSRRVARAIVDARPLSRTAELANVIRRALGHKPGMPKDPATRSFQAIRIHINGELDELEQALVAAEKLLRPGGRLAVVTFHSLEDRIVKKFLRERSGGEGAGSRHRPQTTDRGPAPSFADVSRVVRPSEAEVERNPRARSATLRAARRTSAPAWTSARRDRSRFHLSATGARAC